MREEKYMGLGLKRTAVAGLVMIAVTNHSGAQTFSPYSDFQAMSLTQLGTLQVKLTHVGEIGPTGPAVLFGASSGSLNVALFTPYRRSEFVYLTDDMRPMQFVATTQLLKALIDSVATLSGVTDGNVDPGGDVSFALLNTSGGTKAFEAIVDSANGQALLGKIIEALRPNSEAVKAIRDFGCGLGLLPHGPPTDVTAATTVKASGLRLDRVNTQYVGKIRVTNASGASLAAPLVLVMSSDAQAIVQESEGTTCNISPSGATFVTLLASGSLGPGASIEKTLHVKNPGRTKLNVAYKVFAGAGTP
jgi:hypothetical protein